MNNPSTPSPPRRTDGVRAVTVIAVAVVAAVAAIVSFEHMRALAVEAGEGWRAWILPLSVDGLLAAASMTLLARRRAGRPTSALAWAAMAIGIAASLAANVAAAQPAPIARIVAAWPALAFALAFELLLQQVRVRPVAAPVVVAEPDDHPAEAPDHPAVVPDVAGLFLRPRRSDVDDLEELLQAANDRPPDRQRPTTAQPPAHDVSGVRPPAGRLARPTNGARRPVLADDDQLDRVRRLVADAAANGRPRPGRRTVAHALRITPHRARVLLDAVDAEQPPAQPVAAGHGGDVR